MGNESKHEFVKMFTAAMDNDSAAVGTAKHTVTPPTVSFPSVEGGQVVKGVRKRPSRKWVVPVVVGVIVILLGILAMVFLYPWKHRKHSGRGGPSRDPPPEAMDAPQNESTYKTLFMKASEAGRSETDAHTYALSQLCQMGDNVACKQMAKEVTRERESEHVVQPNAASLVGEPTPDSSVSLDDFVDDEVTHEATANIAPNSVHRNNNDDDNDDDDDDFTPV